MFEGGRMRSPVPGLLIAAAIGLACRSEPKTAEEKKAKGDQILREMSNAVAAVKNFSFTAEVVSEEVGAGGQKTQERHVRNVVVRRPDGFTITTEGGSGLSFWYDGKRATIVSDEKKRWARGPMPPTLDETMDYAAAVYDLKLAWGDLLYSSPYDALMTADTTGGWVGLETIEGKAYDHLSYQHPVVDWEVWVGPTHGVKRLRITYKQDPGQPVTTVTFSNFNLSPKLDEDTFTAKVPEGYERIRLARRDSDLHPVETADAGDAAAASPTPTR
jgi:hypothetical protein